MLFKLYALCCSTNGLPELVWKYLEEDIRFDTDELKNFNIDILEQCARTSRKQQSINTLIKYLK